MANREKSNPCDRLRAERKKRYATAIMAAEAFGWTKSTYVSHENGTREISRDAAERYAKAFRVKAGWLLYGETAPPAEKSGVVRMGGIIGAGQEVWPDNDYEEIESSLAGDVVEAFRVSGDSMRPVARDGDLLFFGRARTPKNLIGRECIVELEDGRRFFKILRRSHVAGRFDLESYNADPIEGVAVVRAGELLAIRRA